MKFFLFIFFLFVSVKSYSQLNKISVLNGVRIGTLTNKSNNHASTLPGIGFESALNITVSLNEKISLTFAPTILQHTTKLSTHYDVFDANNIGFGTDTLPNGFTYLPLSRESIVGTLQLNYLGLNNTVQLEIYKCKKWAFYADLNYTYLNNISSAFKADKQQLEPGLSRLWEPGVFGVHLFGINDHQHLVGAGITLETNISKQLLISYRLKTDSGINNYTNDSWPDARLLGFTGSIGVGYKFNN
jgi:hypothetical protein